MNIMVTGGAGYIGSVVTEDLVGQGYRVFAVDNLIRGNCAAVVPEAVFYQVDISDQNALENIFQSHRVEAVLHLAADTSVEESVAEPTRFFWNNVAGGINLLEAMLKHRVNKLVFSSTAAVYGQPDKLPVTESSPAKPINAYGESKLMFERVLSRYGDNFGMSSVSLRFFNVAGASQRFGADHHPESNLIPLIVKAALGQQDPLPVFGTDYETMDGTGIRDYIHVLDIAQALTLSLDYLQKNSGVKVYNLGNGGGYSVLQVIETARRVTGAEIPIQICPRRPGDPAKLIANSNVAKREIGWQPRYPELESIIESAWRWQKEHPQGYNNR
ncbi:MAG: UDP-glucose 4-epimerase GalE [Chloroflexi bacterium]|nr:UDP-glucose 4-epimerase GalE [Chloroflexota bacterium]